jgi:hypothetical protein
MGSMKTGMLFTISEREESQSYVYEVPSKYANYKACLNSEIIDWVGPLTIKCPYCGSTQKAEKKSA